MDILTLGLSGDAYQGVPIVSVTMDGAHIGDVGITASHLYGQTQPVAFTGDWGPGPHTVVVTFTNDLYGGTPLTDRNAYVHGVGYNGAYPLMSQAALMSTGDHCTMAIAAAPVVTTAAVAPVTVPAAPATRALNLWTPAKVTKPVFSIVDWKALLAGVTAQGTKGGLASKIPCPGGHLDWEYGNPESQFYCDPTETMLDGSKYNPFSVTPEGYANIHAEKGPTPNAGQSVRSGCLSTAGVGGTLFAGGYGFYASRMKWNLTAGFWPAFWFLSLDNNFNYSLELDAFENWQNMTKQIHCGIANSGNGGTFVPVDTTSGFHEYGVDYQADFVTFYVDGKQTFQQPTPANCLNKTIFAIWNIAVGRDGSWAGQPAYAGTSMDLTIDQFGAYATS